MIYCAKNPTENQPRFLVNYLLLYHIKADPCKLAAPCMKAQDRMVQLNAHKCMEKINAFFQLFVSLVLDMMVRCHAVFSHLCRLGKVSGVYQCNMQ